MKCPARRLDPRGVESGVGIVRVVAFYSELAVVYQGRTDDLAVAYLRPLAQIFACAQRIEARVAALEYWGR